MIKKECGSALCKKLDRMVNDVWREGRMLYYYDQSGMFKVPPLLSLVPIAEPKRLAQIYI